jgi:hypothetical protein
MQKVSRVRCLETKHRREKTQTLASHHAPVDLAGASEALPWYRFPIFIIDFVVPGPVAMLPVGCG